MRTQVKAVWVSRRDGAVGRQNGAAGRGRKGDTCQSVRKPQAQRTRSQGIEQVFTGDWQVAVKVHVGACMCAYVHACACMQACIRGADDSNTGVVNGAKGDIASGQLPA